MTLDLGEIPPAALVPRAATGRM